MCKRFLKRYRRRSIVHISKCRIIARTNDLTKNLFDTTVGICLVLVLRIILWR